MLPMVAKFGENVHPKYYHIYATFAAETQQFSTMNHGYVNVEAFLQISTEIVRHLWRL